MDVTWTPQDFRSVPMDEAMMPLPTPLMTPPVTKMYFMIQYSSGQKESKNAENDRCDSKCHGRANKQTERPRVATILTGNIIISIIEK